MPRLRVGLIYEQMLPGRGTKPFVSGLQFHQPREEQSFTQPEEHWQRFLNDRQRMCPCVLCEMALQLLEASRIQPLLS